MDLTHLRYFQAIVDHGSMTAAARALGVSQPSISAAIRRLEERLGTTLFLRTGRGTELTATGEVLHREARGILRSLADLDTTIRGLEDEHVGAFVIGCFDSLGAYFLPGFLPAFTQAHPRVDISLATGPSGQTRQRVIDRDVDFGIVVNPEPHPDLVMVALFDDAVDFFACEAAPGLAEAIDRLQGGTLLFAARVQQSHALLDRLAEQGVHPHRLLRCGEFELVKSLALAGLGVGLLPRRVAAHGQPGLVRLHPDLPCIPDRVFLLYRHEIGRA
ncbi:MAG: LysR family transcriptional regulator, partial [Myxococcales bacterium]|nr:LysR family transcriptional regulator [Myxococcales bacterium]